MTTFNIDISNTSGIAGARDRYNLDNKDTEGFVPLDDDGYVAFVLNSAADSWAQQYAPAKLFTADNGKTFTNEKGETFVLETIKAEEI